MFAIFSKFREFRSALEAGEWRRAARLAIEVLDLLVPEEGAENAIREPVGAADAGLDEEAFKEDAKAVKAALANKPRGAAQSVGAGGALIVTLVTTFGPLLIEFIKKRLKERQG